MTEARSFPAGDAAGVRSDETAIEEIVTNLGYRIAALLLALLGAAAPAWAQTPGLTLLLTPSHAVIAPGGTLRVTIGAINQGAPVAMDVYFVVLMPDGDSAVAVHAAGFAPGRIGRLAALAPLAAGVTLPTGFAQSFPDFLTYTFAGSEPPGPYRILLAGVRPRALADGQVNSGDLLALATTQVTLGPPLAVTADAPRAASGQVTPLDGGTIATTGADGTTYTLVVPPGAVGATTTVTLTPVSAVAGVPGLGSLLAAVQGTPAGLEFARAARLSITVPGGVPPTAILGLLLADDGTGAAILPLAAGATRIELELTHFSTVAIPMTALELIAIFGGSGSFFQQGYSLLATAQLTTPPDPVAVQFLLDHLFGWYDTHIRALLQAGQGQDLELLAGLEELRQWDGLRSNLEGQFGSVLLGLSPVRGRLTSRATEGRDLGATGLARAFTRANDRCLTGTAVAPRLGDAERAARVALLARDYFSLLENNQLVFPGDTDIPSPDLTPHGLDEASVASQLCARAVIDDVVEPALDPNQTGTLTVRAGVSLADGPTAIHTSVTVTFSPDPGASGAPPASPTDLDRTDAAGQAAFPVTASPAGTVEYLVCGVFHPQDFPGLFAALPLQSCRSSVGGVVVTPSQTTIAPGASRQFTAVVEGTAIQDVTWQVTGGGTITQTGLFTSNGTLGTFFVRATSVAHPTGPGSEGDAQITVTGGPPPPPPPPGGLPCTDGCLFVGTHEVCTGDECVVDPSSADRIVFLDSDDTLAGGPGRLVHPGLATNCGPTRAIQFAITVQPGGAFAGVGTCAGVQFTVQGTASDASLGYDTFLPSGLRRERFEGARFTAASAVSRKKR